MCSKWSLNSRVNVELAFVSLNFLTCQNFPVHFIELIEPIEPQPLVWFFSPWELWLFGHKINLSDSIVVALAQEIKVIWEPQPPTYCLNTWFTWLLEECIKGKGASVTRSAGSTFTSGWILAQYKAAVFIFPILSTFLITWNLSEISYHFQSASSLKRYCNGLQTAVSACPPHAIFASLESINKKRKRKAIEYAVISKCCDCEQHYCHWLKYFTIRFWINVMNLNIFSYSLRYHNNSSFVDFFMFYFIFLLMII